MSVFHFKHFDVVNDHSAMKVNTDGVLLGALMTVPRFGVSRILDIGTGTGTIALMAAQRCPEAVVEAIDIDEASAAEAAQNFAASPWSDRLKAHHLSLDDYAAAIGAESFASDAQPSRFSLICSNPPYFDNSLANPDARRSDARHTASLSYREIIAFAAETLLPCGTLALVLPADEEARVCREARSRGLFTSRIVRVRTTPRKTPGRIIVEFSCERAAEVSESQLTIQDGSAYTPEYLALMQDFYLFA